MDQNSSKKNLGTIHRNIKASIQKRQVDNRKDVEMFYGTRHSKFQQKRLAKMPII